MSKLIAPIQLFTVDECISIALMERDDDTEGLSALYEKAKNDFKQKYPGVLK